MSKYDYIKRYNKQVYPQPAKFVKWIFNMDGIIYTK